jgi:hypothetical protein
MKDKTSFTITKLEGTTITAINVQYIEPSCHKCSHSTGCPWGPVDPNLDCGYFMPKEPAVYISGDFFG